MAKKTQYFEHESLQDKESIINYLKALTKGIEKGEILISDEDDTQIINPSSLTLLKLKASKNKKEQSLRIKLSWTNENDDDPDNTPLFIKAQKTKSKK